MRAIVAAMAPADARGRHQGAVVMTFGAAQLVGPKLGCVAARGPAVLWGSCFVLTVVVGRALLVTARARGSRMARGSPTAVVESAPGVAKPAAATVAASSTVIARAEAGI